MDQLDHAAYLLVRFGLDGLPDQFEAHAGSLRQMADLTARTVEVIKKPAEVEKLLVDIHQLSHEMDARYRDLLVELLSDAKARDVIKLKVIADFMADAATKLDRFGKSVGLMAIKET